MMESRAKNKETYRRLSIATSLLTTLQLYINIEHRDDLRMIGYYALYGSNISSSANGSSDPIVAVAWQDMRSAGHLLKLVFSLSLSLSLVLHGPSRPLKKAPTSVFALPHPFFVRACGMLKPSSGWVGTAG